MRNWLLLSILGIATGFPPEPLLAKDGAAPPTESRPVADSYFGTTVEDPYRWLENGDDPAVQAWSEAQNRRSRAYLDALPVRGAIRTELTALISSSSPSYYGLKRAGAALFAMYNQPPKQQPMLAVMGLDADPAKAEIVLDPNKLDPKGKTAIDWYQPSPDGKLVAVSLSEGGSEDGTLHVYDAASGTEIGDPIPAVQYPTAGGSLAWRADGKGFWYTRYPIAGPEGDRHFYQKVYFHLLGTTADKDKYAFGKALPDPKIAEITLENPFDAAHPVAIVQNGDSGRFTVHALAGNGTWKQVAGYGDTIIAATFGPDGCLYLVSRKDAPRSKILKLPAGDLDLAHARVIVPEGEGTIAPVTESGTLPFAVTPHRLYVRSLAGGPSRVEIFDLDGHREGALPVPEVAMVDDLVPAGGDDLLYPVATYLRPPYIARWNARARKGAETQLVQTSPVKFDDAEVVREFAISADGTKIPVNIIRRKGTVLDGTHPVLLYGYGGYGISQTPRFLGAERRVWLDGGGIYAIANIRGGGEYGEDWHRQGALTHKQNVFDDFFAAAEHMMRAGYTSRDRLAIMGGSNGGLLMGAELTQHPDAFRAVVSQVGIYDMLRVELDPNGAFNTTEFGSVRDPDQFKALYAYSPYHHVADGTDYPAVLFMTGANDGRVNPLQSRKMAARLQAATASGLPVLLRTSADSGHGHGSALSVRIDQGADYLAFLFDQLGMKLAAAPAGQ